MTLALDLGAITGWALRLGDGTVLGGSMSFKPGRFEGGGMRYLRFRSWLEELARFSDALEAVYFGRCAATPEPTPLTPMAGFWRI